MVLPLGRMPGGGGYFSLLLNAIKYLFQVRSCHHDICGTPLRAWCGHLKWKKLIRFEPLFLEAHPL